MNMDLLKMNFLCLLELKRYKMIIKQIPNGDYYVCRRGKKRNWFLLKHRSGSNSKKVSIGDIQFPKDFIGKKVRLKIEVIKD